MKFEKGNKLANGGKRPGAGRKSNQVVANEAEATRIAKELLAQGLGEVLAVLKKLCKGVKRMKFYPLHILESRRKDKPKCRDYYFEIEYDAASIRFWLDRFVPAARQGIDINVDSPEEFYRALAAARAQPQQRPAIESTAIPEPESDKRH